MSVSESHDLSPMLAIIVIYLLTALQANLRSAMFQWQGCQRFPTIKSLRAARLLLLSCPLVTNYQCSLKITLLVSLLHPSPRAEQILHSTNSTGKLKREKVLQHLSKFLTIYGVTQEMELRRLFHSKGWITVGIICWVAVAALDHKWMRFNCRNNQPAHAYFLAHVICNVRTAVSFTRETMA